MSGLLAILGFGSCDKNGTIFGGGGLAMYGQPHANYKFLGDVKDSDGRESKGSALSFPRRRETFLCERHPVYRSGRPFRKGPAEVFLAG